MIRNTRNTRVYDIRTSMTKQVGFAFPGKSVTVSEFVCARKENHDANATYFIGFCSLMWRACKRAPEFKALPRSIFALVYLLHPSKDVFYRHGKYPWVELVDMRYSTPMWNNMKTIG